MTTPLIKWAGGKAKIVDTLVPEIRAALKPSSVYFEPFVGGGAVGLALENTPRVFNDTLQPLMNFYRVVQSSPDSLYHALEQLAEDGVDDNAFYRARASELRSYVQQAARFIYLNKLDYNGMYRENASGKFNVPYGKRKIPADVMTMFPAHAHFVEVSDQIADVRLCEGDFERVVRQAGRGDVIYADPPYIGTFSNYAAGGFTADDHDRLAGALYAVWRRGATVFTSNSDTELTRMLYSEWAELRPTKETRSVNADGKGRGPVGCFLIVAGH